MQVQGKEATWHICQTSWRRMQQSSSSHLKNSLKRRPSEPASVKVADTSAPCTFAPGVAGGARGEARGDAAAALLKWQHKSMEEESAIPVSLLCWPSAEGNGTQMILEFEFHVA